MSDAQPITMVDMEQRLAEDASGAYRDELLNTLAQERQALKRQVDGGLAPDDFAKANAVQAALEAAEKVVSRAWASRQRS